MPSRGSKVTEDPSGAVLHAWFQSILRVCDASVFGVSRSPAHRAAAQAEVLSRNAKALLGAEIDGRGALYTPACLVLAAASRRLGVEFSPKNWDAALAGVRSLSAQLAEAQPEMVGLALGTPASIFKDLMGEALVNAGVTDRPTILVEENRRLALGLSINWGLRFLLAYSLEASSAKGPPGARDLRWVRQVVQSS